MSTSSRHRLGVALILIAVLGGTVIAAVSISTGNSRVISQGEAGDVGFTVTVVDADLPVVRMVPVGACFAAGVLCLVWPSREPPRLS